MIDISSPHLAQISCRNSIGQILYVCEHIGEQALPDLFQGVLDTKTLVSKNYQYLGKPLTLDYFKDVSNWYSNDINLTLFDNLTAMGIDAYNTGHYIITSAKKTNNIATIAYLQMLGTKGTINKVNQINQLYNRTKKVEVEFKADNIACAKIIYENGCPHNEQVTRQNIGAYIAILESTGLQQVHYSLEKDDFSKNNYTIISYSWQQTTRFSQFRWLISKLIARTFCKDYMASDDVIRSYHQSFVTSLDLEVAEKEKQRLKSESYYQQLIEQKEQKEAELILLVKEKTIKLEQSIQDKERLFETFSHELKTPLTLIIGPIEQLLKQKIPLQLEQKLHGVNKNAHRLFELVNSLLSLAEINVQREKRVACNIYSTSQYIISSLQPLAEAKGSQLSLLLKCDENLALQLQIQTWELLLTNLITNAIKYGKANNKISVLVQQNDKDLKLTVTDNNQTLTEAEQDYIFNRFTTVNPGESSHGLGLSIVKELVNNHQGKIKLSASDMGNVFTIYLPLTLSTSADQESLPLTIMANDEQSLKLPELNRSLSTVIRAKVLLVEDNLELAEFLKSSCSDHFEITHKLNGRDALLTLEKELFDIIISDVMMPVMDGFEFCQQVKNNETLQHIPLILLTAKADISSQKKGLALQADDYIGKPFNSEVLMTKIRNQLTSREALKRRLKANLLTSSEKLHSDKTPSGADMLFRKVNDSLEANYSNSEIKAADIAKELYMQEKTLNRKLQTLVGSSISELLREYRLNKSKNLLELGHKPKSVYYECGFNSMSYFSQSFKQEFGVPPSNFQKQHKIKINC